VTFQDWQDISLACSKSGYAKILGACEQAKRSNLDYIWVDTNCIDKTSSAELSEAINSRLANKSVSQSSVEDIFELTD
jgi:hypothetical protein